MSPELANVSWHIASIENGSPLLEALRLRLPVAPISFLRQLCGKQRVLLDGKLAAAEIAVRSGQTVTLKGSQRLHELLLASPLAPQQLLYEDRFCLVVNKPAGLATHPGHGHDDSLLTRVQAYFRLRGDRFQLAPVHRLDVDTSGPVLFGKGRAAISQLGKAVMADQTQKYYLALVSGSTPQQGELSSAVPAKGKIKPSWARYRRVGQCDGYSLLRLQLVTGRQHQLRRQLSDAGWPIVGDARYRGEMSTGLEHPFLHCEQLSFPSAESGTTVELFCPLPPPLADLLTTLKISPLGTNFSL